MQECALDLLDKVAAAAGPAHPDWCEECALPRVLKLANHRDYNIRAVRLCEGMDLVCGCLALLLQNIKGYQLSCNKSSILCDCLMPLPHLVFSTLLASPHPTSPPSSLLTALGQGTGAAGGLPAVRGALRPPHGSVCRAVRRHGACQWLVGRWLLVKCLCAVLPCDEPAMLPAPSLTCLFPCPSHAGVVGAPGLRLGAVYAGAAAATRGCSRPPAAAVGGAGGGCVRLGKSRGAAAGGAAADHHPPRGLPRRWVQHGLLFLAQPAAILACSWLAAFMHTVRLTCQAVPSSPRLAPPSTKAALAHSLCVQRCWTASCKRPLGL